VHTHKHTHTHTHTHAAPSRLGAEVVLLFAHAVVEACRLLIGSKGNKTEQSLLLVLFIVRNTMHTHMRTYTHTTHTHFHTYTHTHTHTHTQVMCIPSILVNVFYIEFQTYVLRIDLILNVVSSLSRCLSLSLSLSLSLFWRVFDPKKKSVR